jgi:ABC-type nitrate/sulfonate/bicarbonate transport system permease component
LSSIRSGLPVVLALLALLAAWQLGGVLFGFPAYILPLPVDIVTQGIKDWRSLGAAATTTFIETIVGFLIGSAIGAVVAVVLVLAPPLEVSLLPLLIAINSVPAVAFVPLALIWFGLGMASKLAMAAMAVSFPVLLNMLVGLKRPSPEAINLMRSFGSSWFGILWRLRIPTAMPSLVIGLRVGIGRAAIAVIVAEMLGAYSGIGQTIYQATAQVDYLTVWAAVLVASAGSLLLYGALVTVDRKLVWWR